MWRNIGLLVIGVIIGIVGLLSISAIMRNQTDDRQKLEELVPEQIEPSPEATESAETRQRLDRRTLEELRSKIRKEGITVSSKVVTVFPGTGFIVEDNQGEKLFVRWSGTPPQLNNEVEIEGVVSNVTGQEEFRPESQFTEEAARVMQERGFYLEARNVSQTTPLPS